MITQFAFTAIDGAVPVLHVRNTVVEVKTATGATTAAADKDSTVCRVSTDTAVYVSFGTAPDASSDAIRFFMPAGSAEYFRVKTGDKGAVIAA